MIPQRVKLRGFLCYKDEQEVSFDSHATLWMLSGLNGSGKSSIFDAVTYALFGYHRGGALLAHELINKDSDGLAVEFDFLLDGVLYRAKRTLRRDPKGGGRGATQQIFRYKPEEKANGSWVAVEGTNLRRDFDAWVADNIGLNYDTFTSSVLLLQGKAEKLLDSKPEGRREVLARIVDLERYELLHRKADDQRKAHEATLKSLSNRLNALPGVTPEELATAELRITGAESARQEARGEVERLQGLEYQARSWVELQGRLAQVSSRLEQAQALLVDAPAIEKDVARLRELRDVLPRLQEIAVCRGQVHESEVKARDLAKHKQKLAEQFTQREHTLKQTRDKLTSLRTLIANDEARQREVVAGLRQSTIQLEKLKEYERQEGDLGRVRDDLARLPADPAGAVAAARQAYESLQALAQTVPLLARLQERREQLRQALGREQSGKQTQLAVEQRGKQCAAEVDRCKPRLEEAARVLHGANDQATEARTLLQQARDSLKELSQLDGAKVCRHCGQRLTEGHLKEEKRRRSTAVSNADARLRQSLEAAEQAARAEEQKAREQLGAAEKALQEARLEFRDCQNQMKQARLDVERLLAECAQAHGELPEPFRQRVSPTPPSDWLATTYPSAADLNGARTEAAGLGPARQQLHQAEQVQQQWGRLKAQEASTLQSLNRLQAELPSDREAVRREHTRLDTEDKALEKGLAAKRADVKEVDREIERLSRDRDQAQTQVLEVDAQLKKQELVQQSARQGIAAHTRTLPETWHAQAERVGLRDLEVWRQEKVDLEQDRTDERGKELEQARLGLDVLRKDKESLEAQRETFPPEARQDPAAVVALLTAARRTDRACDEELAQARQQRALLESYRKQREDIEQEYLNTERELASQRLLAELLGRERLQLYLVRQAERQVVEHANAVLDRLSGGQLYLKLSGEANGEGSAAKALELEAYNRSTGDKPINVAFLSGSQKFRVAVSLALGIGQYASRQHRPIESVIIDEGFGCLDSQGRQVMIQELQNLRGQMRCILLVSHQEEFAEAFSDGYHFHLDGGATKVTRVRK